MMKCTSLRLRGIQTRTVILGCVLILLHLTIAWLYRNSYPIAAFRKYSERAEMAAVSCGTNHASATDKTAVFPWKPFKVPDIDCSKLFAGEKQELERAKHISRRKIPDSDVTDEVRKGCHVFRASNGFITSSLTAAERNFPIAYSIVVFKDAAQVRGLLQAIYRPQNFICIHVDRKSNDQFHKAIQAMIHCLDNVFLSSRSVDVQWGKFSVLEADLICMEDLLKYPGWRYFINLTGQEYPLKTSLEMVSVLTALREANVVVGNSDRQWTRRWLTHMPVPHNLTVIKGSLHIAVNRHFVRYVVTSPVAKDLREWVKNITVPDEEFFNTLNHNPQLGIPGSYRGSPTMNSTHKPHLIRFKNWQGNEWPCAGKYVLFICIFAAGDLPLLGRRMELFANKFHYTYSSVALECLAEKLYNRTRDETLATLQFDSSFYQNLPFLKEIVTAAPLS